MIFGLDSMLFAFLLLSIGLFVGAILYVVFVSVFFKHTSYRNNVSVGHAGI